MRPFHIIIFFFMYIYLPFVSDKIFIYLAQITIPKSLDLTCRAPLEYNFCKQLSYITGFFFFFFFMGTYIIWFFYIFLEEGKRNFIKEKNELQSKTKNQTQGRSDWKTTSTSFGKSSTQISRSADKTAFLTKLWTNLFTSRLTCWNIQLLNTRPSLLVLSMIWPNNKGQGPLHFKAWITWRQSPLTIMLNKLSSRAKITALWAAKASAISANCTLPRFFYI